VLRFSFLTPRRPPFSTLFPYTTLFRSGRLLLLVLFLPVIFSLLAASVSPSFSEGLAEQGDDVKVKALEKQLADAHKQIKLLGERSEEHTSELQSRGHLVCRLLLEKKKK